jgi:hypothetical protein
MPSAEENPRSHDRFLPGVEQYLSLSKDEKTFYFLSFPFVFGKL